MTWWHVFSHDLLAQTWAGSEISAVAARVPSQVGVGLQASGRVSSSSPPPRTASMLFPIQYKDHMSKSTHECFFRADLQHNWITGSVIFLFITVKPLWNNLYRIKRYINVKVTLLDYSKNFTMNTNLKTSLQIIQNLRQMAIILLCLLHFLTPEITDRVNLLNYSKLQSSRHF